MFFFVCVFDVFYDFVGDSCGLLPEQPGGLCSSFGDLKRQNEEAAFSGRLEGWIWELDPFHIESEMFM